MANTGAVHQMASQFAQLLGEVIIHHTPWSATLSEQARQDLKDQWLERLEDHYTTVVGPMIDAMTAVTDAPAPIAHLLSEVKDPSAAFGSLGQQFFVFGVMFSLANSLMQPFMQQVSNDAWQANPDRPLSPADIATALGRGFTLGDPPTVSVGQWAYTEAAKSGMDADQINLMASLVGLPPALQELFELFRRGVIDIDQVKKGLQEGDFRDDWVDAIVQLAHQWITVDNYVRAAVQAQLPFDTAQEWAGKTGLDITTEVAPGVNMFQLLHDINGRPPGPQEVGRMANRGIVGWSGTGASATTFEQAIAESDIKTKWTAALQALEAYQPPNGEIRTLLIHGAIDRATAVSLWTKNGVTPEIANAYAYVAEHEQITTDKALAKGDILTLVQEGVLSDDMAISALSQIGYTGSNAQTLVQMAHFRYDLDALRAGVRQVERLYTTHKISATEASAGLASLDIPDAQVAKIMEVLTAQRNAEVPTFSASQIAAGFYYGVVDQGTATNMLMNLGYLEWDAWYLLSIRAHVPLPNEPANPYGSPQGGIVR